MIKKKLINGRFMTCPRCKRDHDILQYNCLATIEEYSEDTTPVYKCPACKWIFAPAGEMPQDIVERLEKTISELLNLKEKECTCR